MIPARSVRDGRRGNAGCVESEEASFSDEDCLSELLFVPLFLLPPWDAEAVSFVLLLFDEPCPTWRDFDEHTDCIAPGLFAFGPAALAAACSRACGFGAGFPLLALLFVWAVVVFGASKIFAVPGAFSVGAEVADARLEYVVETNVELFTVFFVWTSFDVVGLLIELWLMPLPPAPATTEGVGGVLLELSLVVLPLLSTLLCAVLLANVD